MKISSQGKPYIKGRNIVAVFTMKPNGLIMSILETGSNRSIGYVFISRYDLQNLIDDIPEILGI